MAALREGREPPVPGEEARKAVEIILGIYGAAASGKRVAFPLDPEVDVTPRSPTKQAEER